MATSYPLYKLDVPYPALSETVQTRLHTVDLCIPHPPNPQDARRVWIVSVSHVESPVRAEGRHEI